MFFKSLLVFKLEETDGSQNLNLNFHMIWNWNLERQ